MGVGGFKKRRNIYDMTNNPGWGGGGGGGGVEVN